MSFCQLRKSTRQYARKGSGLVRDVFQHRTEVVERRKNPQSDRDVFLNVSEFVTRQAPRLVEHGFANTDLADVVEMPRQPDALHLEVGQSEFRSNCGCNGGDAM